LDCSDFGIGRRLSKVIVRYMAFRTLANKKCGFWARGVDVVLQLYRASIYGAHLIQVDETPTLVHSEVAVFALAEALTTASKASGDIRGVNLVKPKDL
jgi:hypothetical protein